MMIRKRFLSVVVSVFLVSLTTGWIVLKTPLTGDELIKVYQIYAILIGSITGVYQGVQSFTDTKKLGVNNES
jgi:hypothetical protein